MASRALPSHLKPSAAEGSGEGGFSSQRHHGKSQSHVVRTLPLCSYPPRQPAYGFYGIAFWIRPGAAIACTAIVLTAFDVSQLGAQWIPSWRRGFAVVSNTPPQHDIHTVLSDGIRQYQEISTHGPLEALTLYSFSPVPHCPVVVLLQQQCFKSTNLLLYAQFHHQFANHGRSPGFREHIDQRRCFANAQCSQQARRHRHRPRREEG